MGYNSSGQPDFRIPVSDTQAYRQFGNSVVVPVVEQVAKQVILALSKPLDYRPDLVLSVGEKGGAKPEIVIEPDSLRFEGEPGDRKISDVNFLPVIFKREVGEALQMSFAGR